MATPPGMQGIRPGSAAAIAAGYRPPRPQRRPTRRPGGPPINVTFNPDGTTTLAGSSSTPPPAPRTETITPPTTPPVQRNAAWWSSQFASDPRFLRLDPVLRAQQNQIGQTSGLFINRDAEGRQLYKTAGGATGITQQFDDNGNVVYRDAAGNTYKPSDLQLDVRSVQRGETGFLASQLGSTQAGSEKRQFEIGDTAAQAGVRRSGMRAAGSAAETAALQAALANIATRTAGDYAGVDKSYADLYTEIYGDLVKNAADLVTPEAPVAPPATTPTTTPTPPDALQPDKALTPAQFSTQLSGIANMGKNASRQQMIKLYRDLAKNYTLTPAQRKRIENILKSEYKVSL